MSLPASKSTEAEPTSIYFKGVTKTYPDGTVGLQSLDLECEAGKITVLVGPSGCGKTTSLRMINRMVVPTEGKIYIGDTDVMSLPEADLRRSIGYVIQSAGLFPHRNIVDNIATVPRLLGESRRSARERSMELLTRVGLDKELAKKYPYQLSGGQQQRVGVARALASDPPVLLMDEPFSAVDPVVRAELQDELLRLQADLGKTIVFVTHDMDEAIKLADRIVVFQRGGTVAQAASAEELLMEPASIFVRNFTGDSGIKWLSTISTSQLSLHTSQVVHNPATPSEQWRLVIDDHKKVLGWLKPNSTDLEALDPCRRTFVLGRDSMRVAFDSILLSPAALGVAIDDEGTFQGVANFSDLEVAVRQQRESVNA